MAARRGASYGLTIGIPIVFDGAIGAALPCSLKVATTARRFAQLLSNDTSSRPYRILIVDYFDDLREVLRDLLIRQGYVCEAVSTGNGAMTVLDVYAPDLVLMEWNTHDGSGSQLPAQLRSWARQRARQLKIAAFSTTPRAAFPGEPGSFDAYLSKLEPSDLETTLADLLPRRSS